MQISSGDVDKQRQSRGIRSAEEGERERGDKGNDGKCSICIRDAQIHKKIPVSLMGFFFLLQGNLVSHFDSQKNLVKQIRPRPAEQFNYSAWL